MAAIAWAAMGCAAAQTEDAIVTTRHQVSVGGKTLAYTARAGRLPIRDNDTGDVRGEMFFVAYTLDGAQGGAGRPLTFLWNGGPGSNSGLVHLLGFGPKRVTRARGSMARLSPEGTALLDNQDTWLAFTDLVFVDRVGAAYSRPAKAEYGADFYQNRGDAEAMAEFIRVYRTHFGAFDAPLFLLGESYGLTRCALVAEALERRHTRVTGVTMLSGGFPLVLPDAARHAWMLPSYTAAAYYNKKLPADLQGGDWMTAVRAAEVFAKGEYAAAVVKPEATEAQRDAVVKQVARFTGLAEARIDRAKPVVPMEQFANELLADKDWVVGHYDTRLTGPRDPSAQYDPTKDPSLKDILDPVSVLLYLTRELGSKNDLLYAGPFGGGYPPPVRSRGDWMPVRWNFNAGGGNAPVEAFQKAMQADEGMRAFVGSGYYDLASSYFGVEQPAAHLPADLARRVTVRAYAGGHAIYTDDAARRALRADGEKFYRSAVAR